jgi:small subunit ribosomal protein S19
MTRSVWKGPFVHPSLLKKIDKLKDAPNKKPIKTWSRHSTIIPDFVGHSFMIHNGKTLYLLQFQKKWLVHKLGEFAPTRTFKGQHLQIKKPQPPLQNLLEIKNNGKK